MIIFASQKIKTALIRKSTPRGQYLNLMNILSNSGENLVSRRVFHGVACALSVNLSVGVTDRTEAEKNHGRIFSTTAVTGYLCILHKKAS